MQVKTIFNRVQKFKGSVYQAIKWVDDASEPALEVQVVSRSNTRGLCRMCGKPSAGYDTQPARRYEFIPFWGIRVFFMYSPRRVTYTTHGIHVEQVPWSVGKHQLTQSYAWYLAGWAKRLSWKETAEAFRTSWYHVFHPVEMAVDWGFAHRDLSGVEAIGVDEIQ